MSWSRVREEAAQRAVDDPIALPVTDVFDLHSVPPADAEAIVVEYLSEARRLGYRVVRIIHGRGIGYQRAMVRRVLAATAFVAEFSDAPLEAGGWGATIATLVPETEPGGNGKGTVIDLR